MAMQREHAILSASGAHRWLKCTPSARLEEKYPDMQSEAASEGTFAHALGELRLQVSISQIPQKEYADRLAKMRENEFWSRSLMNYVDEYVDYVIEQYNEALTTDEGAAVLLEQHLDFSEWVPQGFGRGDAIIISDGTMQIIDLKYGRHVAVTAENNPQLRLYALGAVSDLSCLYNINEVQMSIVQPRNGGISTETMPVKDLLLWGDKVKAIAKIAIKGEGEFVSGEHCRFCKAAPRCREMMKKTAALEPYLDRAAGELSDVEVATMLKQAEDIISWLHKVQDYALKEARDNGQKWPGYKLVEGRSTRKYADEKEISVRLLAEGFPATKIFKPQALIGITDMQKLVGKKQFDDLLSDYIIKPPGKPTLVPESDSRPEWNSPDSDFEDLG